MKAIESNVIRFISIAILGCIVLYVLFVIILNIFFVNEHHQEMIGVNQQMKMPSEVITFY